MSTGVRGKMLAARPHQTAAQRQHLAACTGVPAHVRLPEVGAEHDAGRAGEGRKVAQRGAQQAHAVCRQGALAKLVDDAEGPASGAWEGTACTAWKGADHSMHSMTCSN